MELILICFRMCLPFLGLCAAMSLTWGCLCSAASPAASPAASSAASCARTGHRRGHVRDLALPHTGLRLEAEDRHEDAAKANLKKISFARGGKLDIW